MSEMIERVAKAIHFRRVGGYFVNLNWDTISEVKRNDYRSYAEEAIAALMHPTEEMKYAGFITANENEFSYEGPGNGCDDIGSVFNAMLGEALWPTPTTESKDE